MRGPLCYFSAVVEKLDREINAALADPKMKARLPTWAGQRYLARPPTLESSWPMKPR
jgi:hypothetical protein